MSKTENTTSSAAKDKSEDTRKKRLAAQLRENLARRKAQARSRRKGEADQRPDGLQPDTGKSGE